MLYRSAGVLICVLLHEFFYRRVRGSWFLGTKPRSRLEYMDIYICRAVTYAAGLYRRSILSSWGVAMYIKVSCRRLVVTPSRVSQRRGGWRGEGTGRDDFCFCFLYFFQMRTFSFIMCVQATCLT